MYDPPIGPPHVWGPVKDLPRKHGDPMERENGGPGPSRRGKIRLWAGHALRWGKKVTPYAVAVYNLWNGIGPSL